jgi:hypothetical protein
MLADHNGPVFLFGGHLISLDRLDYGVSLLFERTFKQTDTLAGFKRIGFYKVVRDGSGRFAKHVGNDSIKGYIADGKSILEPILFAGLAGNKLKPVTGILPQDPD